MQPGPGASSAARLRRLSESLALAPADADDAMLLRLTSEALGADGNVALLLRSADGAVRVVGPVGVGAATNAALAATVSRIVGEPAVGVESGALHEALAESGLAVIAMPVSDGAGEDVVLLWPAAAATQAATQADEVAVAGALLGAARALRASRRREAETREQLERNARDGRELAHQLNNDLTMPVGVVELLLDRATVPPDLRDMLQAAATDLASLEEHIREFHIRMRTQSSGPDSEA